MSTAHHYKNNEGLWERTYSNGIELHFVILATTGRRRLHSELKLEFPEDLLNDITALLALGHIHASEYVNLALNGLFNTAFLFQRNCIVLLLS